MKGYAQNCHYLCCKLLYQNKEPQKKNVQLQSPLLLGHILPIAARHVIELLAWVEALTDADGLEISSPKVLKEAVVGAEHIIVEFSV